MAATQHVVAVQQRVAKMEIEPARTRWSLLARATVTDELARAEKALAATRLEVHRCATAPSNHDIVSPASASLCDGDALFPSRPDSRPNVSDGISGHPRRPATLTSGQGSVNKTKATSAHMGNSEQHVRILNTVCNPPLPPRFTSFLVCPAAPLRFNYSTTPAPLSSAAPVHCPDSTLNVESYASPGPLQLSVFRISPFMRRHDNRCSS
jgi:hypothetical protein